MPPTLNSKLTTDSKLYTLNSQLNDKAVQYGPATYDLYQIHVRFVSKNLTSSYTPPSTTKLLPVTQREASLKR